MILVMDGPVIAMMVRKQVLLEKLRCNYSPVKCIALFSIVSCMDPGQLLLTITIINLDKKQPLQLK